MRAKYFPYLVLLPTLIFLFAFTYFPLLRSAIDSLYDTRMNAGQPQFVGLDNMARLLRDTVFWQALWNNVLYILLTVIPGVLLALLLAVVLWENTPSTAGCAPPFLSDDCAAGQRGDAVAVYLYAGTGSAGLLSGENFRPDEQ